MNLIDNLIGSISDELLKNRRYNYCEDVLNEYLQQNHHITCNQTFIKNKRGQSLNIMIIKSNNHSTKREQLSQLNPTMINLNRNRNYHEKQCDTCLVYAHGLGSNKLEGLNLAKNLLPSHPYHVCSFDFSGSGKSEGEYTTYGNRQQDDINAVLAWLDAKRTYSKYILWGRSMGGTAIILSQVKNLHPKIQCIVLDSPFSSFEKATIQIASKNSILPEIMLGYLMKPLKTYLAEKHPKMNPFSINIAKQISGINSRIMLIYSKGDNTVNYSHSKQISKYCRRSPIELEIQEDHNKPRNQSTYLKALDFIMKSVDMNKAKRKKSLSRGRGISVSSKQHSIPKNNSKSKENFFMSKVDDAIFDKTLKFDKRSILRLNSMMTQSLQPRSAYTENSIRSYEGNIIKSVLYQRVTPLINHNKNYNKSNPNDIRFRGEKGKIFE